MKLLFYINAIHDGGAERVMVNLTKYFYHRGYEVILLTSFADECEYPVSAGVQRMTIEQEEIRQSRIKRNITRIKQIREICIKEKPDAIISFMQEPNFRALIATIGLPVKTIVSVRNDPNREYAGIIGKIVGKVLLPTADGCVFQTEQAKSWFPARLQKKSRVIVNPVSDVFYNVQGTPLKEKRIVTCGRLENQKRFDLLIDAFDKVCDDFPEYTLEIYGTGTLADALNNQIMALGRADRIRLMGRCHDVPNTIKDASLFVLSSDYEGLPNALMEAMALGLPVISTDCGGGGARVLIENGVDGLLVPCGNADALAEAIRSSLVDVNAMKARGEMAKEKGKTFATENITAVWEQYICEVCDNN